MFDTPPPPCASSAAWRSTSRAPGRRGPASPSSWIPRRLRRGGPVPAPHRRARHGAVPLGEAYGGYYFLAIDPTGRTYLVMDDIKLIAESFDEALELRAGRGLGLSSPPAASGRPLRGGGSALGRAGSKVHRSQNRGAPSGSRVSTDQAGERSGRIPLLQSMTLSSVRGGECLGAGLSHRRSIICLRVIKSSTPPVVAQRFDRTSSSRGTWRSEELHVRGPLRDRPQAPPGSCAARLGRPACDLGHVDANQFEEDLMWFPTWGAGGVEITSMGLGSCRPEELVSSTTAASWGRASPGPGTRHSLSRRSRPAAGVPAPPRAACRLAVARPRRKAPG